MMGLVIIFFFLLYIAISAGVVWFFAKKAKQRGIAGWKWGVPAGLVMYLLVFWDHIPTLVAHKYYCDKYAGLTVYKTPEQWKAENPGVAAGLIANEKTRLKQQSINVHRFDLNQRFAWDIQEESFLLGILQRKNLVVDKSNHSILIEWLDFETDIKSISLGARNLCDYKVWLNKETCNETARRDRFVQFDKFVYSIKYIGGNEK